LVNLPGGSGTLYFHQKVFTDDGRSTIFIGGSGKDRRVWLLDRATKEVKVATTRPSENEVLAPKSRKLYFSGGSRIYEVALDTGAMRVVAELPAGWDKCSRLSINADETLLASTSSIGAGELKKKLGGGRLFDQMFDAHLPNKLFTVDIATGKVNVIHEIDTWLGHVQFSPKDPGQIMFCHEGPWGKLDRIWVIRADGSGLRCVHPREAPEEIAGHEFWSGDGKTIWFDNPYPTRANPNLASVDLESGKLQRYPLKPEWASVHFSAAPDDSCIVGEGGATNKYLLLFHLKGPGVIEAEKLVDLAKHDYKQEPDMHFTPDGKWAAFHSGIQGPSQVYAVRISKETATPSPEPVK
jgi:oligogalacturonide lyase